MFTGIIEEIGEIRSVRIGTPSSSLTIQGREIMTDIRVGDSIAVNGVCLTVTSISENTFTADVMAETLRRSSLGSLHSNSRVNLERAMPANGRFGGHIVSGHIDGIGTITALEKEGNAVWVTISASQNLLKYMIEKGSVAIDGISLTIAHIDDHCLKVSLIPHTGCQTTLLLKKVSDIVNLECDLIGKFVEKLLLSSNEMEKRVPKGSNISEDFLRLQGFI